MQTASENVEAPTDSTGLPLVLRLRPVIELSDDQLLALCEINHELWIERNAQGELLLMPPAGVETSGENAQLTAQLVTWANRDGTGIATDCSGGFRLPNGAMRAPDAAWISHARLASIPSEERKKLLPLCPDFVVELRSPSDALRDLQAKLEEWIANGAQLGWLLDSRPRQLYVYRAGAPVLRLDNPVTVSGDPLLPGFVLDLQQVC